MVCYELSGETYARIRSCAYDNPPLFSAPRSITLNLNALMVVRLPVYTSEVDCYQPPKLAKQSKGSGIVHGLIGGTGQWIFGSV